MNEQQAIQAATDFALAVFRYRGALPSLESVEEVTGVKPHLAEIGYAAAVAAVTPSIQTNRTSTIDGRKTASAVTLPWHK